MLLPLSYKKLQPKFDMPKTIVAAHDQIFMLGQETLNQTLHMLLKQRKAKRQHLFVAGHHPYDIQKTLAAFFAQKKIYKPALSLVQTPPSPDHEMTFTWHEQPKPNSHIVLQQKEHALFFHGNLTKAQLFGRHVDHSQHTSLIPGVLLQHSTVILPLHKILKHQYLWRYLMESLVNGVFQLQENQPKIPLNCSVILIGDHEGYADLKLLDLDFIQAFPLFAELHTSYKYLQSSVNPYYIWLATIAQQCHVELTLDAYPPLMRYCAKLADHQERLTLLSMPIEHLIQQAIFFSDQNQLNALCITQAMTHENMRHNLDQQLLMEAFIENFTMIATDGAHIGQINALLISETANTTFGEPARITATVHFGDGEISDIEKKSDLSGNIHTKGMQILSACLYRIFGKDEALHLDANIVFEQSYLEVDGDSASLAQYCALISAISEQPIFQHFAVTGSIDQFGHVQPIGGVNEKIIGFFELCEHRGLTGKQGVLIPHANRLQLNLPNNVVQAVKNKKFAIFLVKHVDEAIALLTDKTPGQMDEFHFFPDDSLYGLVQARLSMLSEHDEEGWWTKVIQKLTHPFS